MEKEKQYETLGDTIKGYREDLGLTQEVIGKKCNVTEAAVSKWERNLSLPNVYQCDILARIFNISIEELINSKSTLYLQNNFYSIREMKMKDMGDFVQFVLDNDLLSRNEKELIEKNHNLSGDLAWGMLQQRYKKVFIMCFAKEEKMLGYLLFNNVPKPHLVSLVDDRCDMSDEAFEIIDKLRKRLDNLYCVSTNVVTPKKCISSKYWKDYMASDVW